MALPRSTSKKGLKSPAAVLRDGAEQGLLELLTRHAAVTVASARRLTLEAQHAVDPPALSPASLEVAVRLLNVIAAPTLAADVVLVEMERPDNWSISELETPDSRADEFAYGCWSVLVMRTKRASRNGTVLPEP